MSEHVPTVVEGEVVALHEALPRALQHPPALRTQVSCRCGKGSVFAHGLMPGRQRALTCDEVLAIRARVAFGRLSRWQQMKARFRNEQPEGWPR